jgi:hypothetical protein
MGQILLKKQTPPIAPSADYSSVFVDADGLIKQVLDTGVLTSPYPIPLTAGVIATPPIDVLANTSATYQLNVPPHTRYRSNGTSLVEIGSSSGGGGGVSSVAATGTNGIQVTGSPITSSGTLTIGLGNITPTTVAATGTVTGSNLSGVNTGDQNITLTGDVTGSGTGAITATLATVPITKGGTGQTTAQGGRTALLPPQAGLAGRLLQTNGTDASWEVVTGTGSVTSVSVVTANGISGVVANPATTPAITLSLGAITPTSVSTTTPIGVVSGGTGNNALAAYAPVFGGTTSTGPLQTGSIGTVGQVLTSNGPGALPSFQPPSSSGLTVETVTGTTYSLSSVDNGKVIRFTNTGAITVTVPTAFSGSSVTLLWRTASGTITVVPSGTTINGSSSNLVLSQANGGLTITPTGTANEFDATGSVGDLLSTDITDSSAAGRTLLTAADATAQRTALALTPGVNVQAFDAELSAIAGLTSGANLVPYFTGVGTAATTAFTPLARTLVGNNTQAEMLTTIGATPLVQSVITDATTARTLQASDNGQVIRFTSSSPVTITVPTGFSGFACRIIKVGTGPITLVASGTTINNNAVITAGNGWATLIPASTNTFDLIGEFTGAGGGSVTSVAVSGGTTGLSVTGSPITGSGIITLAGTLAVTSGGTGGTTQVAARAGIAAAAQVQSTGLGSLIETPTNKTYRLMINSPFAWTATSISVVTASGTCSVQARINGVNMTGGSAAASTTVTTNSITANNAVVATDTVDIVISANAAATDLSVTISGTRTLT